MTEVRAATPQDALGVARVHVRSWQVAYRGLVAQDYLDRLRPADKASRYTFDRSGPEMPATLIAVEQEEIWGFATTGPSQDTDLPNLRELWAIYVDPQHWGQGVGRLLMTAARDRLAMERVKLCCGFLPEMNALGDSMRSTDGGLTVLAVRRPSAT